MHGVEDPDDHLALLHEYGALPIRAAASRQERVFVRKLGFDRHHGIKTEGLIQDESQVFELLDLLEGGRLAGEEGELVAQFGPDVGAAGEDEEGGGHEGGSGVTARYEGVDDLVAEFLLAGGVLGKLVEEDVAFFLVVLLGYFIQVAILTLL